MRVCWVFNIHEPLFFSAITNTGASVALDGATNIVGSKDLPITITFSEAIDATTATTANIKLYKGSVGGVLVPLAAPAVDAAKTTVKVKTLAKLDDSTAYTLVIGTGITNAAGTALGAEKTYAFTTGSAAYVVLGAGTIVQGPTQLAFDTVVNANVTGNLTIDAQFNKDLLASSVTAQNVKLYNITDSKYVINPAAIQGTDTARITTSVNGLEANKNYRIEIGAGLLDFTGASVVPTNIEFTTFAAVGVAVGSVTQGDYTTGLNATTVWPKLTSGMLDQINPAPQNPVKFYVKLNSNAPINETTITASTVKLERWDVAKNVSLGAAEATLTYNSTFKNIEIVPKADLADGANYRLTVVKDGIKDVYGNKIAESITNFKTFDLTAPALTGVQFRQGASAFAAATSGMTGVNAAEVNSFKFVFSEKIGVVDYKRTGADAPVAINATNSIAAALATSKGKLMAGETISIYDNAADATIKGAATLAQSADQKEITLTIPAGVLTKGKTYTLYVAGKNGLPTGSLITDTGANATNPAAIPAGANAYIIADVTDGAANANRMADTYQFSFVTADADQTPPTISSVKVGTTSANAVAFSEKIFDASTAAPSTKIFFEGSEKIAAEGGIPVDIYDVTGSAAIAIDDVAVTGNPTVTGVQAIGTTNLVVSATANFSVGKLYKINTLDNYFVVTKIVDGNNLTIAAPLTVATAGAEVVHEVAGITFDVSATGKVMTVDLANLKSAGAVLAGDKEYRVNVNTKLADLAGNNLASAGAPYSFVVDSATNTVTKIEASVAVEAAPSTSLPNNAVIKGSNFLVTFGEDYDANSVSASTITIKNSAGTAVDCAITFPTATTVLLDPNADLTPGETYTVEVNGVKSKIGNTFKTYRATAIVADTTAPKVSAITPADGAVSIAVNSGVTIKFDKPLDPATAVKANFMVSKNANLGTPMDATVTYDSATNTVTVKPASFMEKGTVYYVGIDETKVKGDNGVAVGTTAAKVLGSFTTANVAIAPKITSATMYKGAADAHTMVITFEVPTGATLTGQDNTTYLFGGTTWDGTATYTADLSAGAVSTTLTAISDVNAALVTSNVSTIAVNAEAVAAKALKDVNGVLFDTTPVKITKVGW